MMNIYGIHSNVGLAAGRIFGDKNQVFVQVAEQLNIYVRGAHFAVGGIFGHADYAKNTYMGSINELFINVLGDNAYVGGLGGVVKEGGHNSTLSTRPFHRYDIDLQTMADINKLKILAVTRDGMVGAFFGAWLGKQRIVGILKVKNVDINVSGPNMHVAFFAGMVEANDMDIDLQAHHAVLEYVAGGTGRVGLVTGLCTGNENRVFIHNTSVKMNVYDPKHFAIFAAFDGDFVLMVNNVDIHFKDAWVPSYLVKQQSTVNQSAKSKLTLLSFSLSPSNKLLQSDCYSEITVDQAGLNFDAHSIQCDLNILDSKIPLNWRALQRKLVKNCRQYNTMFYVNEQVTSLVAHNDHGVLFISKQRYPYNTIENRNGLQRITRYIVKESFQFNPQLDENFGLNNTLLYAPSPIDIELPDDFPVSTFADQNILLQIYWVNNVLYITSFDLTLHKDSVYRVKDIRSMQKEENACFPIQLDGYGLWMQCGDVLSYFIIDVPTLSVSSKEEHSITLHEYASHGDFLFGVQYKEDNVYVARMKTKNFAYWNDSVKVQRYSYSNGTYDALWREPLLAKKISLFYIKHYQLVIHAASPSLLFKIPSVLEYTFLNDRKKILFLNVAILGRCSEPQWRYRALDAKNFEKKHSTVDFDMMDIFSSKKKKILTPKQMMKKQMKRMRYEL